MTWKRELGYSKYKERIKWLEWDIRQKDKRIKDGEYEMTDCIKCLTYKVLWCKDCSEHKYTCKFCGIERLEEKQRKLRA